LLKNVLVVDDSPDVRDAIRLLLEGEDGLTVCGEAKDGIEGIWKAAVLKRDLILLDLAMPKLNAAAAALILKGILPGVPIILFTMHEDAVDALAPVIGVDMVLSKPHAINHLARRVQELLYPALNSPDALGL
jgi:DNA-binding NarL/FixJ family response regulator